MNRVMVADDEGIVIDSMKFIIEKEFGNSCEVECAKSGRNVIELAEGQGCICISSQRTGGGGQHPERQRRC